ncbi:CdiA family toxin C-terminal domain-containing protein [Carnobacterium gallinarum]|uniref:CdiA family toxin C-terminal domain-containing protein n=1 Tax=Carnobacterium gallinarum TaxID=2749 RepID=UPI001B80993A|nr:CdiA family toxin C-terminal domain-containing protein [Carnobacterium gallinarum]
MVNSAILAIGAALPWKIAMGLGLVSGSVNSYEAISGNTIGGRELSGKERILRGVFGALDLALVGYSGVKGFKNRGSKVPEIPEKASGAGNLKIGENAKNHLKNVEGISTKKGISGGHNADEFYKALQSQGINGDDLVISKTSHPTIDGVYEVEYRIPRKDITGNVADPVTYKNARDPKTLYDPSIISDDKMYELGSEAMQNGKLINGRIEGTASNGLNFIGYLDEFGNVKNFYPILD